MAKIKAFIIRDFKDAGSGSTYFADSIRDIESGAFANYRAAGLVRLPTAADTKTPVSAPDASDA